MNLKPGVNYFPLVITTTLLTACRQEGEVQGNRIKHSTFSLVPINETAQAECTAKNFSFFKICENGIWRAICDLNFTKDDAMVMCRELGYSDIGMLLMN